MNKRSFGFLIAFVMFGYFTKAQDYFADRNNAGTPIFLSKNGSKNYLFSAGVNTADATAIKINLYKQNWGSPKFGIDTNHTTLGSSGWGVFANASTKGGVGKLFKSGNFDPGFSGGVYYALTEVHMWKDGLGRLHSKYHAWIFNGNIGFANNQLYDPSAVFANQLSTKKFTSPALGVSYVYAPSLAKDDLFVGGSVSWKKKSNYDDLDTYNIVNDSLITANGITRKVTKINPSGDTYAVGAYKEFSTFQLRANLSYIPAALDYRFGVIIYPSVEFGGPTSARINTGIAFNYLQDGNPTLSVFTINFELNDINNAAASTKTFLKRAFKVGISTNLNFVTGR